MSFMNARLALSLGAAVAVFAGCAGGNSANLSPATPTHNGIGRAMAGKPLKEVMPNVSSAWSYYNYNPSGRALYPQKANYSNGVASFTFDPTQFTALLTTGDKSLTGDLTGRTLSDTITVSGATDAFVTQNGGGCGNPPAARFYFATPGFAYTNFWWSNPVSYVLANGTATLTAPLSDPSQWSDWNGMFGTSVPSEFAAAVAKVQVVGLSFGGDCFFENGATVASGSALFQSQFSEY